MDSGAKPSTSHSSQEKKDKMFPLRGFPLRPASYRVVGSPFWVISSRLSHATSSEEERGRKEQQPDSDPVRLTDGRSAA